MRILGIDISTRDVALTLICTNTRTIIKTIKVEFPKGDTIIQKISELDNSGELTNLVLNEDIDQVYIENNIATGGVLYKGVNLGYYHITGYLMGQFNQRTINLINNNTGKKNIDYITPLKKDYDTAIKLKKAKEIAAINGVKKTFYKVDEIDSDNADAALIAWGGYNGKIIK